MSRNTGFVAAAVAMSHLCGAIAQEAVAPDKAPALTTRQRMEQLSVRMREEAAPAKARDAAITQELKTLTDQDWGWRYSTGGGLSGLTLSLVPEAGFTFHHWSDRGDFDLNHGTVKEVRPDRIVFECVIDPKLNNARMFAAEMFRVTWGKRRYLVSGEGMIQFCNAFNDGSLERARTPFIMLRDDDWSAEVSGLPSVPEEFKKYLLAEPIEAAISEVLPPERGDMPAGMNMERVRIRATLTAGSRQGLLPGMRLSVREPEENYSRAEVIAVKEDQCTVEFTDYMRAGAIGVDPKPGWRLSTRSWVSDLRAPKVPKK